MTLQIATMSEAEAERAAAPRDDAGLGALRTERGNLPLDRIEVSTEIVGLVSSVTLTQEFVNVHTEPLEATYVFPLPDRAAVTGMRMTAADRVVEATLRERGEARQAYDSAIAAGQRAAIAEEERPDVFTMRVGNIVAGERVTVTLTLAGALAVEDGEATFRFPLVVAPRYVPGAPLPGGSVGAGYADDTDAVPDASRITPPVLLPGFPHPVRLDIEVGIDPAGLPLRGVRSSLYPVVESDGRIRIRPGERADRDFVLRLAYGAPERSAALVLTPDPTGDEGTYQLTALPPADTGPARPRDVVLLLDRSGSMEGWKMVAARRAAARIVDTLTDADRFAVLAFDHQIETPSGLPDGLVAGTDRHRFRAVEQLARMTARGGTELLDPLRRGLRLLGTTGDGPVADGPGGDGPGGDGPAGGRDRVLVLVTDGQVGNEDHILREAGAALGQVRVHTVGIDQAVNAGFLGRLASVGGGRCELVESEDRLDVAMAAIHRRIGSPLVTGLRLTFSELAAIEGSQTPQRLPDLFPGVPYVVYGRYRGNPAGSATLSGATREGEPWSVTAVAEPCGSAPLRPIWARAALRDLEDRYAMGSLSPDTTAREELEGRIVQTSLRFGVLCRFTAYVAVDTRRVTGGDAPLSVVQPVEYPAGWEMPLAAGPPSPVMPSPAAITLAAFRSPAAAPAESTGAPPPGSTGAAPPEFTGAVPPVGSGGAGVAGLRATAGRMMRKLRVGGHDEAAEAGLAGGAGETVDGDRSTELRVRAAEEAGRLRQARGEPEYRRRELLEDLATRLAALARDVTGDEATPLRALVELLTPDRIAQRPLAGLWDETLRMLDAMAAGDVARGTADMAGDEGGAAGIAGGEGGAAGDAGGSGEGPGGPAVERRPFWK